MDTNELRAALHEAMPELEPRPTLTADVMRGGRRRLHVRRLTIAGATVAAAALVATTVSFGWQIVSEPNQVATDPLMTKPTRGDLAGDQAFVDDVLDAWDDKDQEVSVKVVTRPHVYWAGNTPAGRAAVVMQETDGRETVRGLVGVDAKTQELRTLILDEPMVRQGKDMGYKFGPENRFVMALTADSPLLVSYKVTYDGPEGQAVRTWHPMRDADGVSLAELPAGSGPMDARVIAGDPMDGISGDEIVDLYHADETRVMAEKNSSSGLNWGDGNGGIHLMRAQPGSPPAHWNDPLWLGPRWFKAFEDTKLLDPTSSGVNGDTSGWYATAAGPDSSLYLISEYITADSGPARLYAVAISASGEVGRLYSLGPTRPDSPLPVLVELPDKSAKVAVVKGTKLSYRTTVDGPWATDVDEALRVPLDAVEIRVTKPGQAPAVVPASR